MLWWQRSALGSWEILRGRILPMDFYSDFLAKAFPSLPFTSLFVYQPTCCFTCLHELQYYGRREVRCLLNFSSSIVLNKIQLTFAQLSANSVNEVIQGPVKSPPLSCDLDSGYSQTFVWRNITMTFVSSWIVPKTQQHIVRDQLR